MDLCGFVVLPHCNENVALHRMKDRYGRTWYSYHRAGYHPTPPRQSRLDPKYLEEMYSKPPYTLKEVPDARKR